MNIAALNDITLLNHIDQIIRKTYDKATNSQHWAKHWDECKSKIKIAIRSHQHTKAEAIKHKKKHDNLILRPESKATEAQK